MKLRVERLAIAAALFLSVPSLGAQTAPQAVAGAPRATAVASALENPWSRFEIISFGVLPIALFYSDFSYDFARWATHSYSDGFAAAQPYAPWPFKNEYSAPVPDVAAIGKDSKAARLITAVSLSLVVGGIDAIIHAKKVKAAERLREASRSLETTGSAGAGPSRSAP